MKYLYTCAMCEIEKEVEHPISACDTISIMCSCGGKMERKIVGGTGFLLEGSGWYRDGYSTPKPPLKNVKGSS